ncbi:hypothetical protein OCU04_011387 [Sclerotinia nivalis]|uniref:Zn(2)-C6 fungal-type domain-containing protein n=1 Tax=Sclerotinia nivalis TaxID=352851 RepID=A0A9X0AF53_9HELO|nr:hypothetical protein OCU04_011387 [Sclerotinia nivalis]
MDNNSKLKSDDGNPDIMTNNNPSNHNESIFGIPNMFNSANFAQASILSNDAESTIASPNTAYASIFSDVPSSTNNSPVSAQTSIFSGGQNSNVTSPVTAQTSIFGNVSNSNLISPTSAQINNFSNPPTCTITTTNTIQPITQIPEVDLFAHDSEPGPEPEPDSDPDIDPDIEPDYNHDLEITSDVGSRSISSSPEAPDFDAPAAPAPETLSLSSDHCSPPIFKCNMPRTFAGFGVMFNSTKRSAAIKGQAQRIGAVGADKDDSGTYDPSLEGKRNSRNTRAKKNKENGGGEETSKIGVGTRNGRKTKEQGSFELVITIKLTSEEGLKYLKEITPGPEGDERNFPPIYEADDDASGSEDEDDEIDYSIHSTRRKKIKTSHNRRSDGLTLEELDDGHPQRRGCKACFETGDDECSLIEYSHEWPCESCEDAGVDCELIIPPELKLSCIRCKEKLRKRCSYADDGGKGVESCKACEGVNVKCIAGLRAGSGPSVKITDVPASAGTKRRGSMSTKAEGIKKGPNTATVTSVVKPQAMPRKYVSCNRCRVEFKGRCSLKREDEGPCNRCVKANVACTFIMLPTIATTLSKEKGKGTGKDMAPVSRTPQDLTQTIILESTKLNDRVWRTTHPHARRIKAQQKAFERAQSSCSPDVQFLNTNPINHPNNQMTQTNTPSYIHNYPTQQTIPPNFSLRHKGIRTITITTSFSHPLIFNYKRDPMSLYPPCDFDTNPFFGLFGYGLRLVTVVPWPSITGAGYEELENGWGDSDVGHEATRMCIKCTYARVKILGCAEHELRPIEGLDERMRDEEIVRDSVDACEEGLKEGRWGRGTGGEPEVGSRADLVWRAKWCAVCPRPGDWVCKFGGAREWGRGEKGWSQSGSSQQCQSLVNKGCGLILCDTCYELHGKVQKGGKKGGRVVLGRVIHLAGEANRREDYPDGVRADAGFLREDGELFVRMQKGGCAGYTGKIGEVGGSGGSLREGIEGRGMGMRGGFDDVDSNEMSWASSNHLGEGRGINRAATPFTFPTSSRKNTTTIKKMKGKDINPSRPRQILHSVTVSRGEVVRSEVAGKGNSVTNTKSGTMINKHGDIKGEVAMDGALGMVGKQTVRRNETYTQAFTNDFEFTGDGVSSGRWKGKGVDRKIHDEFEFEFELGEDEDEVMRSIEREVIELSD